MTNSLRITEDGILEAKVIGDQDSQSFRELYEASLPLVEQLRSEHKLVLGLVDLTQKGNYTPGSNRAAMQLLEGMTYDRTAMFGAEAVLKEVTEMIILAMGKRDNTKLFNNREDAVAWLKSPMEQAAPESSSNQAS